MIDRRLLQLIDSHRLPELYAPTGEAPKGRCNSWLKGEVAVLAGVPNYDFATSDLAHR